nr:hypothetical protein [uncultured Albidiferax sp.]
MLGLEKLSPGRPCFAHQIRQCAGACVGSQPLAQHNLALLTALTRHKVQRWPHTGPIGLREGRDLHVLHDWRYLGTARSDEEVAELLESGHTAFDFDTYKILSKALAKARAEQIVRLGKNS